jgi:hypothetical protein
MVKLLFTMYVNDEYTARMMEKAAKKLKFIMYWQRVKDGAYACDYFSKDETNQTKKNKTKKNKK